MHQVAKHGALSLTLMKRILAKEQLVALTWFTDLVHPVITFDTHELDDQECS